MPQETSENDNLAINKEKLRKLILDAFDATKGTANKELVLVIGNTGAGKSTMINYLLHCSMEEEVDDIGMSRVVVKAGTIERAKIGHKLSISATLYPEAYQAPEGFYYCDCPGFGETRSPEHRITTAIATKITVNAAKQIKSIVVVLEQSSLIASRAQGLRDIFDTLQEFFRAPNTPKAMLDTKRLSQSILFVITKATNKRLKYPAFFEAIKREAMSKNDNAGVLICDLILTHGAKLIEVDPVDQGESRQTLVSSINRLTPLAPSDFGTPADVNTKRELSDLMAEIAVTGNQILDTLANTPNKIKHLRAAKRTNEKKLATINTELYNIRQRYCDGDSTGLRTLQARLKNAQADLDYKCDKSVRLCRAYNSLLAEKRNVTHQWNELNQQDKEFVRKYNLQVELHNIWCNGTSDRAAKETASYKRQMRRIQLQRDRVSREQRHLDITYDRMKRQRANDEVIIDSLNDDEIPYDRSQINKLTDRIDNLREDTGRRQRENKALEENMKLQDRRASANSLRQLDSDLNIAIKSLSSAQQQFLGEFSTFVLAQKISHVINTNDGSIKKFLATLQPNANVFLPQFIKAFRTSANQQDAYARYCLGLCSANGLGVVQNDAEAVRYYKLVSHQKYAPAQYALGLCYEEGIGLEKSEITAMTNYHLAAEQRHELAKQRREILFNQFKNAAGRGEFSGQIHLGECYEHGYAVPKDRRKAAKFYRLAANMSHKVKHYYDALHYYNKILTWYPNDRTVHTTRGQVYEDMREFDNAFNDYTQAGNSTKLSDLVASLVAQATTAHTNKRHKDALWYYSKILTWYPNNRAVHTARGQVYEDTREFDNAFKDYTRAGNSAKISVLIASLFTQATTACQSRDYQSALWYCNKVLKWDPNSKAAYIARGHIYEQTDQWNLAYEDYVDGQDTEKYNLIKQKIIARDLPAFKNKIDAEYSIFKTIYKAWLSVKTKTKHQDKATQQLVDFKMARNQMRQAFYVNAKGFFTTDKTIVSNYLENIGEAQALLYKHLILDKKQFRQQGGSVLTTLNTNINQLVQSGACAQKTWLKTTFPKTSFFRSKASWVKVVTSKATTAKNSTQQFPTSSTTLNKS